VKITPEGVVKVLESCPDTVRSNAAPKCRIDELATNVLLHGM
jgi:hypothetical protein